MASNIVQCVLAVLVILHPSAFLFTCSAHLPNPMDNPTDDQVQEDSNNNSSGEESNIILLNNINKKIWDANSLAPGLFCSLIIICQRSSPLRDCYTRRAIFHVLTEPIQPTYGHNYIIPPQFHSLFATVLLQSHVSQVVSRGASSTFPK